MTRTMPIGRWLVLVASLVVSAPALAQSGAASEAAPTSSATLTIELKNAPAGASVTIDNGGLPKALLGSPQPIEPGRHVIAAHSDGLGVSKQVDVAEGQQLALTLNFTEATALNDVPSVPVAPAPVTPSPDTQLVVPLPEREVTRPLPVGFWVAVGVTGAGLVTGGVALAVVAQKQDELKQQCFENVCPLGARDTMQSRDRWARISTVAFITAGVGAGAALVFYLTRPNRQVSRSVTPWVGVGAAGVSGTF